MSQDAGYSVITAHLNTHAQAVDTAAATMEQAASAGTTVTLDTAVFGKTCSFLVPILTPLQQLAVEALKASGTSLQSASVALRTSATTYDAHETTTATAMTTIDSQLGGPR